MSAGNTFKKTLIISSIFASFVVLAGLFMQDDKIFSENLLKEANKGHVMTKDELERRMASFSKSSRIRPLWAPVNEANIKKINGKWIVNKVVEFSSIDSDTQNVRAASDLVMIKMSGVGQVLVIDINGNEYNFNMQSQKGEMVSSDTIELWGGSEADGYQILFATRINTEKSIASTAKKVSAGKQLTGMASNNGIYDDVELQLVSVLDPKGARSFSEGAEKVEGSIRISGGESPRINNMRFTLDKEDSSKLEYDLSDIEINNTVFKFALGNENGGEERGRGVVLKQIVDNQITYSVTFTCEGPLSGVRLQFKSETNIRQEEESKKEREYEEMRNRNIEKEMAQDEYRRLQEEAVQTRQAMNQTAITDEMRETINRTGVAL